MQKSEKNSQVPPKKYHPKGLNIIFEDNDIIVVDKDPGMLSIATEKEKHNTAHFLLNEYVTKGNAYSKRRVFIVHRLDRETSGILVFAKSERTKRFLQDNWKDFRKKYVTVVHGKPTTNEGEITSYLYENSDFRVYSVENKEKGKFSKTGYKVLKQSATHSLLEIYLFTGRKNQIRVHLSEQGYPIVGDKVYGKQEKGPQRLALHSYSLTITHPFSKKEMTFETPIPQYFKSLVH